MDSSRKLIMERAAQLGTNLAELSRGIGRNHAYLQQFVNRGIPRFLVDRDRLKLAQLIKVDEERLRGEDGDPAFETSPTTRPAIPGSVRPPPRLAGARDFPIYGCAEGGEGTLIITTDPIEYVPRPYTVEGIHDAYGIVIEGTSMMPAFRPGDTAWVNPRFGPARDTDVILYSLGVSEQHAMIKHLKGFNDTNWTLQQWNPANEFKLKRAEWQRCHRVVGKFSAR